MVYYVRAQLIYIISVLTSIPARQPALHLLPLSALLHLRPSTTPLSLYLI